MKKKYDLTDKSGQKIGNFQVLKDTGRRNTSGNRIYLIECLLCNSTFKTQYDAVKNRKSKSCDFCRFTTYREDKIINNWYVTIPAYVERGSYHYFCICLICNKLRITQVTNIFNGTSKSCCGNKLHFKPALNILYKRIRTSAAHRKKEFTLNFIEFEKLVTQCCYYCGSIGRNTVYHKGTNSYHYFSGIDRIDSKIGYVSDNCVPCCEKCNTSKMDSTMVEYEKYLDNLVDYRIKLRNA